MSLTASGTTFWGAKEVEKARGAKAMLRVKRGAVRVRKDIFGLCRLFLFIGGRFVLEIGVFCVIVIRRSRQQILKYLRVV